MSIERGYDAVDRLVGGGLEPIEFGVALHLIAIIPMY